MNRKQWNQFFHYNFREQKGIFTYQMTSVGFFSNKTRNISFCAAVTEFNVISVRFTDVVTLSTIIMKSNGREIKRKI